jgi:hypothetical protein
MLESSAAVPAVALGQGQTEQPGRLRYYKTAQPFEWIPKGLGRFS